MKELFDKFQEQLKTILSGGLAGGKKGGLAGAAEKVGLKFSKGGLVPNTLYASTGTFVPRGTDTVPAMLTPGELVIPRDDVKRLSKFLDGQSGGSNAAMVEALAQRMLAVLEARPINLEVKISDQTLATAVFNAQRRGYRI